MSGVLRLCIRLGMWVSNRQKYIQIGWHKKICIDGRVDWLNLTNRKGTDRVCVPYILAAFHTYTITAGNEWAQKRKCVQRVIRQKLWLESTLPSSLFCSLSLSLYLLCLAFIYHSHFILIIVLIIFHFLGRMLPYFSECHWMNERHLGWYLKFFQCTIKHLKIQHIQHIHLME